MAKLITCTPSTVAAAIAGFDMAIDPSSVTYAYRWSLTPLATGLPSSVVYAVPRSGDALVDLKFSPPLSPGETYTLTADDATVGGVALAGIDKTLNFAAPGASLAVPEQYKVLENISWALTEELAYENGRPETVTTDECPADADVLPVESTLGFPKTGGQVWCDGKKYSYTSIVGSTLRGVLALFPTDGLPIQVRSIVVLDLAWVTS